MVIPSSGDADGDMAMNSGLEGSVKDMVTLAGRIGKGKEPNDGEVNEERPVAEQANGVQSWDR